MAQPAADLAYAVAMHVGGALFTLPAEEIDEVMRSPRLTRVPHGPASLEGVANLRGVVLPVFSLASLLDLPRAPREAGDRSRVVVLREARMGISVDDVTAAGARADSRSGARMKASPLAAVDLIARAALAAPRASTSRETGLRAGASRAVLRAAVQEVALLGFELAGQVYALPLSNVEEVLRTPPVSSVATSDAASLGVMELRGAVLPLMSLRALLGLPAAAEGAQRHVVVARLGEMRIGLAVDALASVMRAPEHALSATPTLLNRGGGEARIASIYRAGAGRLVSILSPDLLFAEKSVAHAMGPQHQEPRAMPSDTSSDKPADKHSGMHSDMHSDMHSGLPENREQIVVFRLGDEEYGLPISAVDEITRAPDAVTRLPNAPAFIEGVMNLRGRVVPLVDQARRFGVPEAPGAAVSRKRVIVTRLRGIEVGFVVDSVTDILSLSADQTPPAPALGSDSAQTFDRVALLDIGGRMILLVDPKELLDRVERDTLQALAAQQRPDAT